MHVASRRSLSTLLAAALVLISAGISPAFAAPRTEPGPLAQVLSQGPGGLVLRIQIPPATPREVTVPGVGTYRAWTIPGFADLPGASEGTPDLPRHGFPFGLPEGATARIGRVRVIASSTDTGLPPLPAPTKRVVPSDPMPAQVFSYEPDAAAYARTDWVPSAVAELGPVFGFRHQRVQSLVVNPVRAVPATGAYETVQELEVEIRFEAESSKPAAPRMPVIHDAPGWDETLDGLLLNAESARSFRTRPLSPPPSGAIVPGATYLRVRIGDSGLCRIPYADLAAAGWPIGAAVGNVRVEERGYNKLFADPITVLGIPRLVEDTDGSGTFDAGDFLVFYGMNYKDRFNPSFTDARYSFFHTYWVTDAAPGLDYPVIDGYPAGTGYAAMDSFPEIRTYEQNLLYVNNPGDSGTLIFPLYDTHYWLDSNQLNVGLPFTVSDLAPGASYRVRARWQGRDIIGNTQEHYVALDLNGTTILPDTMFMARFPFVWNGTFHPAAGAVGEGANTLTVRSHTKDLSITRSGTYFDWFEITYGRRLAARGNVLAFNTGALTGGREIAVTGFTSPDVLVLDVTDPAAPVRLTADVVDAGGTWTARIRVTLAGGTHRYLAAVPASVSGLPPTTHPLPPDLGTAAISLGLPRDLLTAGEGSDYILITHPDFQSAWDPLVTHRENEQHRVFVCNVWEIYDQFAGGDKTPRAIQRFLSEAFRRWDPSPTYLLLGGDASEDYRTELTTSDPDWVPTMMAFGDVPGTVGLELSGTDAWYAAFLRPGDPESDTFPDMYVARLPVGTTAEIQIAVQKILDYEGMDRGDGWRERGFFLADDQYSSGILSNSSYCYQPGEIVFRTTTKAVCDSIRVLGGLAGFNCNAYFLADYLDTAAALGRNPGNPGDCKPLLDARTYTRLRLTPAVLDSLSRGWLIWEFTGHANKNQITHEALLEHRPSFSVRDMDKVNNLGKPFLFMGYACHLIEFEGYREKIDGQSIGEELLFAPNRGAIGVMAAPSYEWLPTNPTIQRYTSRALFWNLPRDPATGRPRRIFAESMTRGLVGLVMENPSSLTVGMPLTYQNFGDPALRIDVWAALFADVEVDDAPWQEGDGLVAPSFTDSVGVAATVSDDVDVASIRVLDAGVELPPGRVRIVRPSSGQEGSQAYQAEFKTLLHLGTYDVVLEATDWAERVSRLVFPVRFEPVFRSGGRILDPSGSNQVDPNASVEVEVRSAAPLAADGLSIVVDGTPYAGVVPEFQDGAWHLEVPSPWAEGDHTVELFAEHPDATCVPAPCPVRRSVSFSTSTAPIQIESAYFYPNPLEGSRGTLVYSLNRNADRVQLTIYTVRGRRVLRQEGPALAGLNAIPWDLRDERGDAVANGIYLGVLRVLGVQGETKTTASDPVRIAVTR